jgi:hypothetical protein
VSGSILFPQDHAIFPQVSLDKTMSGQTLVLLPPLPEANKFPD